MSGSTPTFTRHRGPVTSVAGIPGRAAALSVGYDSAVAWVDLEAGTFELLGYHDHLANHVVVEADGARAATSSSDYGVTLWDLRTRRPLRVLRGHFDDVNGFAFVDARTGASVSHDCRVYVWDLDSGAVLRVLEGHEKYAMSIDAGGGCIYSSGDDMTLRQWDARDGRLLRTWGPFAVETDSCAVDAQRARVALGGDDGRIRAFDARDGRALGEIAAHASGIKRLAVSPHSGDLLSAGYDQRVCVWDAHDGRLKVELARHAATWERSLAFTPDGRHVLGGTFDGTLLVWDASDGRLLREVGAEQGPSAGNACFNDVGADGRGRLALVSDDGRVRLATLTQGQAEVAAVAEPRSGRVLMNAVTFDSARGRVLAGAHDQKLHVFALTERGLRAEREVALGEGPVNCVRVAEQPGFEGHAFVACYSGRILRVTPDGQVAARLELHEGAVKALRLHPREALGVSGSADGAVVAWTLDGQLVERFHGHTAIADDVDLDPSGRLLCSVSRDFSLRVYELASGRLLHSIPLGQRSPKSVCFWDEDTVCVGNYWGRLSIFTLGSRRARHLQLAANGLSSLQRSGPHLVATSYDGAVYLVDPRGPRLVNVLRVLQQRVVAA